MEKREGTDLHPLCGRLCSQEDLTNLVTRMGLIEGDVLGALDKGELSLRDLMKTLRWEACAVAMATGSLLKQGLIRSVENGGEVYLGLAKKPKAVSFSEP